MTTTTTLHDTTIPQRLLDAGVLLFKGFLKDERFAREHRVPRIEQIVADARGVAARAPLFVPVMFDGKTRFKLHLTNCGLYGWLSSPPPEECAVQLRDEDVVAGDKCSYSYSRVNPYNARPWPPMPPSFKKASIIAASLAGHQNFAPDTALLNFYASAGRRLGLHQDRTERNLFAPIVSLSVGNTGVFHIGGPGKKDPLDEILLESGDCLVMSRASRNFYHALVNIIPDTGDRLAHGGRLNITVRQVF